jgi:general secretion pathway protein G
VRKSEHGLTLLELIVATAILVVLSTMALPLARLTIQRQRERQLRIDLWEMRDAIDRYKGMADAGKFQTKVDSQGYPPDLDTLVKGVDMQGTKFRFLRRIPIDPMTGTTDWGLRSMQDDPDSESNQTPRLSERSRFVRVALLPARGSFLPSAQGFSHAFTESRKTEGLSQKHLL